MIKKSQRTFMAFLVLILSIGYMPNLFESFYQLLYPSQIKVIQLDEPQHSCPSSANECVKTYTIQLPPYVNSSALMVGKILAASSWMCDGQEFFSTGQRENLAHRRSTHNEFFVIGPEHLEKCKSGKITAHVYHIKTQKKSGILSSDVSLAPYDVALKAKSAQEFTYKDYKIINLAAIAFVLMFSYLIRVVSFDSQSSLRIKMAIFLFTGAFATSYMLEVLLPFEALTFVNRWVAMLSYCIYVSLAASYLIRDKAGPLTTKAMLASLVALLIYNQDIFQSWIWFSFFASAVWVVLAVWKRNPTAGVLSGLLLSTSFEFIGVLGLPNSYIVPSFLAVIVLSDNLKAFHGFLKINRVLKLVRQRSWKESHSSNLSASVHSLIRVFKKMFKVQDVTILSIVDSETIHMLTYRKNSNKARASSLKEFPPVFAHVITTGNSLIDVRPNSEMITSIKKSSVYSDASFTVLPLRSGGEIVGAISLTNYAEDLFKTELGRSTFMFCLDILNGLLVEYILTAPKSDSLRRIAMLSTALNEIQRDSYTDVAGLVTTYGQMISSQFGWRLIAFGAPDSNSRLTLLDCYNLDPAVETQMRSGNVYAHRDNFQGPLAIAVNEKKIVCVPNTKWLEGVVHPNTTKFFNIHRTTTAAFIPVLDQHANVVGVYWIEGITASEITYADRDMFNYLVKVMGDSLKMLNSDAQLEASQKGLSEFIPSHLVQAYLSGEDVVEKDFGALLMLDLKGSTRLAQCLGNDVFHKEIGKFKESLTASLVEGWTLRQFVWDGFEFTRSMSGEHSEKIDVFEIEDTVRSIFAEWKAQLKDTHGDQDEVEKLSYRICFSFGDISRGVVVEGATRKWTLIGDAVAVASKVEQASKELKGFVFCDAKFREHSTAEWSKLKVTTHGLEVYGATQKRAKKAA